MDWHCSNFIWFCVLWTRFVIDTQIGTFTGSSNVHVKIQNAGKSLSDTKNNYNTNDMNDIGSLKILF